MTICEIKDEQVPFLRHFLEDIFQPLEGLYKIFHLFVV